MNKLTLAAALILSSTAFGAAHAVSAPDPTASPDAQIQPAPGPSEEAKEQPSPSHGSDASNRSHRQEGFLQSWLGWDHRHDDDGDNSNRHHRHGHHHWNADDDDDDGGSHHARNDDGSRANRPADPNAASAPVPDNGVFNNKARPKVEVQ